MDVSVAFAMWMVGVSLALHMRLETSFMVRGVINDAMGSIGFVQSVLSMHMISIAVLPGALMVVGMWVLNAILELVLGMAVVILVGRHHDDQAGN